MTLAGKVGLTPLQPTIQRNTKLPNIFKETLVKTQPVHFFFFSTFDSSPNIFINLLFTPLKRNLFSFSHLVCFQMKNVHYFARVFRSLKNNEEKKKILVTSISSIFIIVLFMIKIPFLTHVQFEVCSFFISVLTILIFFFHKFNIIYNYRSIKPLLMY